MIDLWAVRLFDGNVLRGAGAAIVAVLYGDGVFPRRQLVKLVSGLEVGSVDGVLEWP